METLSVQAWDEFKPTITGLRKKYGYHTNKRKGKIVLRRNQILFRGQPSASWPLQTTLERASSLPSSVLSYLRRATEGVHEIESFSGHRWNVPDYPEIKAALTQHRASFLTGLPAYDYLVYLRHHGFPSPLLDWSESPYVAAFFAYESTREESEEVAVYCYIESPEGVKSGWGEDPSIRSLGPFVTTDKRHFSQKARYTIATRWDPAAKQHFFVSHENIFKTSPRGQDVLVKIKLPRTLRSTALQELDDYNINHFTLFHSEDALVKAIGMRAFDLHETWAPH